MDDTTRHREQVERRLDGHDDLLVEVGRKVGEIHDAITGNGLGVHTGILGRLERLDDRDREAKAELLATKTAMEALVEQYRKESERRHREHEQEIRDLYQRWDRVKWWIAGATVGGSVVGGGIVAAILDAASQGVTP